MHFQLGKTVSDEIMQVQREGQKRFPHWLIDFEIEQKQTASERAHLHLDQYVALKPTTKWWDRGRREIDGERVLEKQKTGIFITG